MAVTPKSFRFVLQTVNFARVGGLFFYLKKSKKRMITTRIDKIFKSSFIICNHPLSYEKGVTATPATILCRVYYTIF